MGGWAKGTPLKTRTPDSLVPSSTPLATFMRGGILSLKACALNNDVMNNNWVRIKIFLIKNVDRNNNRFLLLIEGNN